jgi:hypothetical protein
LKITPIAFNPTNSKDIRGNELIFEYDDPVTLNVPAKAKITKFKPLTNQVEIFLERGGTLHNLYIGHAYPTPDVDNPENEIVECANSQIISNLTQTYSTGDYLTIFTDGKGLGDVINLPSIDIFDCSLFALRGGILEIKELKGWKLGTNRDDPDFGYQDVILYGLGNHLSQKSLALKKYLVEINSIFRENYDRTNGLPKFKYASGIWKLQPGVAPFEAFPANLSGDPVSEALEDMTDEDYTNALNTNTDYIKIPADISSYIIFKGEGEDTIEEKTDPIDSSIDYYLSTPDYEYVYNDEYFSIKLNDYKTMINADASARILNFITTKDYSLCYAFYLDNLNRITFYMNQQDSFPRGNPLPDIDIENIFSNGDLPIYILRPRYTYSLFNWNFTYSSFKTYTPTGPVLTPNFASKYPVPKFTDSVIHRKKEPSPSATYVDTNSTSDFYEDSVW